MANNELIAIGKRLAEVQKEISVKAAQDKKFRDALLANPKGAIEEEYGIPAGGFPLSIQIVEEKPNSVVITIPPAADNIELSDEQLEAVAGGYTGAITGGISAIQGLVELGQAGTRRGW
jgi:hypothetical protein